MYAVSADHQVDRAGFAVGEGHDGSIATVVDGGDGHTLAYRAERVRGLFENLGEGRAVYRNAFLVTGPLGAFRRRTDQLSIGGIQRGRRRVRLEGSAGVAAVVIDSEFEQGLGSAAGQGHRCAVRFTMQFQHFALHTLAGQGNCRRQPCNSTTYY